MINALMQLNWLAVLTASASHFVLGGVWFAGLMARHYSAALGIADRPPQKPGAMFLIGPFLCSAMTIATTAVLLLALGITNYGDALMLGAFVGVGYLAAMTMNIAINPLFPRPFAYALVNAPFFVIGSLMSCVILVALS
jgi:hypothetical protein